MNSLCLKFKTEMYNEFPKLDFGIIIYGSNILDTNSSDLDVCIICDNICAEDKEKITKKVIEFHHENNLKIDQEVPYESKLILSYQDIREAIIDNPFVNRGIVSINPIVKTEEFLAFKEMKKRLILNILTTKHISINCKKVVKKYEEEAWNLILNTIIEYASLNDLSPENILRNLYCDANTGNEGEMFLGYKNNSIEKEKHLIKQIKKALNRYKKKRKTIILCNNLNPYLPDKKMRFKLASNVKLLKTYPTATSNKVNRVISDKLNVPIETTIVTNGSTEAFDYLLRIPNIKKVGIFTPTFWGYESACKRNNCDIIKMPLKDNRYYEYDKINELSKNVDMIFICNPNNPTLDILNKEKLLNIIRKNQNCHFVIDETELVFNADYSERTLINETINNINLSVITSVSKFFGVPGLRCGFIITNEVNAKEINKIRILFSINIFSELFMINFFNRFNDIKLINKIQKNFTYLISNLNSKYIKEIINVNTGFILIRFDDSIDVNDLTEYLQTNGIIIRNIKKSYPNFLGECIRVSAGKRNEFNKLIKYINLYMENKTKYKGRIYMYNINKELFIREELNGITVYDIVKNIYKFYEGVELKEYFSENEKLEKNKFEKFLEENKNAISSNVKVKYPFRINWLISDVCNLDCIYCCANNKMNPAKLDGELLKETAKHMLTLSPLTVGLTGGEPTLCPEIGSIIDILDGKCAIVIDTNGTTSNLEKYIDKIKNSNTTVRITIDSMDNDISNKVRPYDENQINKIKRNIELLKQNNVRVSVHTVVTKINYDSIIEIGRYLRKYKIEKWQLYPVNYSERCKDFFDEIKVSDEELEKLEKELNKELEKEMLIRVYRNQVDFRAKGVIFANSIGEFYTDTIFNGVDMIGERPTLQKLIEHTNVENHIKDYLFN